MKIARKNIAFNSKLLLAFMLLSYSFYMHHINTSATFDLAITNSITSSSVFDSEIHEEEPLVSKTEFNTEAIVLIQTIHFPTTFRLRQPDFAIWQPPKIS